VLGIVAIVLLLAAVRWAGRGPAAAVAVVLAGAAMLATPAAASASVAGHALGPFDTPFEPVPAWRLARALGGVAGQADALVPGLERAAGRQPDLMATQTSALAAPFIYDTGREVLPIGGYTGTIPEPTLATLQSMLARGDFHLVIQAPRSTDPRLAWIAHHCLQLSPGARSSGTPGGLRLAVYYCSRSSVPSGATRSLPLEPTAQGR
jgi:hypothetical protein